MMASSHVDGQTYGIPVTSNVIDKVGLEIKDYKRQIQCQTLSDVRIRESPSNGERLSQTIRTLSTSTELVRNTLKIAHDFFAKQLLGSKECTRHVWQRESWP